MVSFVYILALKKNGTIYVGSTSDLVRRVYEHKNKFIDGFTKKYCVDKLVYYEIFNSISDAAYRELCLKKWKRQWKLRLIEKDNAEWKDLYDEIVG